MTAPTSDDDICKCGHKRIFHYDKRKTHKCDAIIFTPEGEDNKDCECKGFEKLKEQDGPK